MLLCDKKGTFVVAQQYFDHVTMLLCDKKGTFVVARQYFDHVIMLLCDKKGTLVVVRQSGCAAKFISSCKQIQTSNDFCLHMFSLLFVPFN
jgi:hypothetical protein